MISANLPCVNMLWANMNENKLSLFRQLQQQHGKDGGTKTRNSLSTLSQYRLYRVCVRYNKTVIRE